MFGFSSGELLLVALIALIVLGPERLPKAARFAGLWIRRARAQWYSVKSELDRELAAEEIKRSVQEAQRSIADVSTQLRDAGAQAQQSVDALRDGGRALVDEAGRMPQPAGHAALDADADRQAPQPIAGDVTAPPVTPPAISTPPDALAATGHASPDDDRRPDGDAR
ncbi:MULTISPECIES: Sec-independent protein translocase protein TatB [Luteimonas]|uniref:Sec-independent protein translocase protein TatB n=1 Tax=Luteimonas TaxID=83614 RepID=UPI000C7C425E|nr:MULTISPECIES: Sec-independent protein translocase protein TatB [Luteimonas]